MAARDTHASTERPPDSPSRPRKALTIGAVAKILGQEFDEVSISKIRYLEDQGLLSPRRTPGGYRLYSQSDVERLRAILSMQRDEFLPLKVIRQELARGPVNGSRGAARKPAMALKPAGDMDSDELLRVAGISDRLLASLIEFKILRAPRGRGGFSDADAEIARAAGRLADHGVEPRHLRAFLTAADREARMVEQQLGPALASASPERRREAERGVEEMVEACSHLRHLLLVRELRRTAD